MAPGPTCMSMILMVLTHFVARDSDASLPILMNMTTLLQVDEEEEEVCLPGCQLSVCGGERLSEEQVVSPQTHKNNCFHVPGSLAGPSDRGRIMGGCTVKRMGG